jgi:hypothetical protein
MIGTASRQDPLLLDVVKASIGIAGLAMCITLVFLGMRSVMDIGGACADGGPYVPVQPCPVGAPIALVGGIFGLFLFVGIAMWFGARVGGIWAAAPLLAWSGLFLALGWNFLDYGIFNPPGDEGIIWGWAFCGIVFVIMGGAPLLGGFALIGNGPGRDGPAAAGPRPGPGAFPLGPAPAGGDPRIAFRLAMAAPETTRTAQLRALATDMGSVINEAAAAAPVDPAARERGAVVTPEAGDFPEGTQALLDRLERLADLRDRGLLGTDEYETAKDAVMHELGERS